MMEIPTFTKADFLGTARPYEYLYDIKNKPLMYEQAFEKIQKNAYAVGVRNFKKINQKYEDSQKLMN